MTNTEKRLEEYCKKFGLCKEKGTCQCKEELKFIADLITQALAEDRERVREIIKEKGHQQEDGTIWVNMDDLLSSLDKPLTDK